jgi:hypothetical protein
MIIPEKIINKPVERTSIFYAERKREIIEIGWRYLFSYFDSEEAYFKFLENLSTEKFEKFLYTIYFYWAHDLYRLTEKKKNRFTIDGFMFQVTLSIIENLNRDISEKSRRRVRYFFNQNFSKEQRKKLNKNITGFEKNTIPIKRNACNILLDMRNQFVHNARWFNLIDEEKQLLSSFSLTKTPPTEEKEYVVDIRISYLDYLEIFWSGFLKYFGK